MIKFFLGLVLVQGLLLGLALLDMRAGHCEERDMLAFSGRWATYKVCYGGYTGFMADPEFIRYI